MSNEVEVKQTQQQFFDKFVNLYHEQNTIADDIKQLSEEFKEAYADADLGNLKAVAKLVSVDTLGDKVNKVNKFKEAVELFVG